LRPDQKRSRSASDCDTTHCVAPAALDDLFELRDLVGDLVRRAVGFGQQDRLAVRS
jgi:hypothetical protein